MAYARRVKYWIALQQVFGQGNPRINHIVEKFGSAIEFYRAGEKGWREIPNIRPQHLEQLANPDSRALDEILQRCEQVGCQVMTPEDKEYPDLLRNIYGMPAVLYLLGSLEGLRDNLSIAMVGTRGCTSVGMTVASDIARGLAREKVVVVSGMAKGIDSACHWGAIQGGGETIAVLSCGLDQIYPPENIALWSEIRQHGGVLSEYPPGTSVTRQSFQVRNRLISGLSRGVVMVEGARHSGTSITISHALEQGKEIFVVPWNANTVSGRWAVELLRQGAIPVASAAHVLEEYGYCEPKGYRDTPEERQEKQDRLQRTVTSAMREQQEAGEKPPRREKPAKKTPSEKTEKEPSAHTPEPTAVPEASPALEGDLGLVYQALEEQGLYFDLLCDKTGLEIGPLTALLTQLELMGLAQPLPGGRYRRR